MCIRDRVTYACGVNGSGMDCDDVDASDFDASVLEASALGTVEPRAAVAAYDCVVLETGVILISVAFRSSVA